MSYSIQTTAASKVEARAAIEAKFDAEVIPTFPNHQSDRAAILSNVDAVLAQLGDDPAQDVVLSVNGYIAWSGDAMTAPLTAVGITCHASLQQRKPV